MTVTKSHTVVRGDTLSAIAKKYQKSLNELIQINQITKPDVLQIGQVIYLEPVFKAGSLQVMFMDLLRSPIKDIKAKLKIGETEHLFQSNASGLLPSFEIKKLGETVEVWVQNARKEWKKVGETIASAGQQWMNLVSPSIKLTQELLPHKPESTQQKDKPVHTKEKPHDGKAKGTPIKQGSAIHEKKSSAHNTIELSVDIPQDLIEYFKGYKDEPITEDDWQTAADRLQCDVNVLKAIAKVESGGHSAYWKLKKDGNIYLPTILYERHYFHRLTKGRYDGTDPDVSWKVGYLSKKHKGISLMGMTNAKVHETLKDKAQREYTHDNRVDEDDVYSTYASAYLRLLKAYGLDKNAALKSCSWGKFQIMGANHKTCEQEELSGFVKTMCSGEKGQLGLLVAYIRNKPKVYKSQKPIKTKSGKIVYYKPLPQAVREKDWRMIAYNYNGSGYETYHYHTKLKNEYNDYEKSSAR
jgi:hypothetical protein